MKVMHDVHQTAPEWMLRAIVGITRDIQAAKDYSYRIVSKTEMEYKPSKNDDAWFKLDEYAIGYWSRQGAAQNATPAQLRDAQSKVI